MKRYLGDAVYFEFDGFNVILTTEDGIRATNTIVMEPEVVSEFMRTVAKILKEHQHGEDDIQG